jgi:hypothetical protein
MGLRETHDAEPYPRSALIWPATETHGYVSPAVGLVFIWFFWRGGSVFFFFFFFFRMIKAQKILTFPFRF